MASKPKLMLDTNVCGKLVALYRAELPKIKKRMNKEFHIVASPQTFTELLNGMIDGSPEFFELDKEKFRIMLGTKSIEFLPFPVTFALKTALDVDVTVLHLKAGEFENQVRCVLHAKSAEELFGCGVRLPGKGRRLRGSFDRAIHQAQHQSGIDAHNDLMQKVRSGKVGFPTPEGYARGLAKELCPALDADQLKRLAAALNAVYEHDKELCIRVTTSTYNFQRNKGDWVDGSQLFYLCDPNLYILTDDEKLLKRAEKSTSSKQIILLRDFLKDREFGLWH